MRCLVALSIAALVGPVLGADRPTAEQVAAVVGALLFVASAYAAKLCEEGIGLMPGVDEDGNVDFGNPGEGQCRSCLNTKNGKVSLKCVGNVPNESGENQKYKNSPDFDEFTRSLFKVKADGAAKFVGKGAGSGA